MIILVLASLDQSRTSLGPVAIETSCTSLLQFSVQLPQKLADQKPVQFSCLQNLAKDWTELDF